jgi:hypothetical protein
MDTGWIPEHFAHGILQRFPNLDWHRSGRVMIEITVPQGKPPVQV